jgi:hypothetical protein
MTGPVARHEALPFRLLARATAVLVLLLGTGCSNWLAPEIEEILPTVLPDAAYEELFPYYVELCAVSQFRSLERGEGGIPGHAVMYLKGACKDENAAFPSLRPCRRVATTLDDPEHGAGVSVNRWFHNANWVAIPGPDLFYSGGLEPGETLDQAAFERTVQASIDAGVFDGVDFHPDYPTTASERNLEDFIAHHSLATDFALRFSRTAFCARLPVTGEMMGEIAEYLNVINEEYSSGEVPYEWSGYADNCVHLLRNSIAAASIWRPLSVRAARFRQFFNLAIPANEMVKLADLGAKGPLADGREVYRNDEARDALLDFDWLPRRHGAMLTVLPVHTPNELYDTRTRLLVLEGPFGGQVTRRYERLVEDARFTDLTKNLEHFQQVYGDILAQGEKLIAGGLLPLRSMRYLRPTKRYFGYVESQLAEVEDMLGRLEGR